MDSTSDPTAQTSHLKGKPGKLERKALLANVCYVESDHVFLSLSFTSTTFQSTTTTCALAHPASLVTPRSEQILRLLRTAYLLRLERDQHQHPWNFQYRHHMYHLGFGGTLW